MSKGRERYNAVIEHRKERLNYFIEHKAPQSVIDKEISLVNQSYPAFLLSRVIFKLFSPFTGK